MIHELKTDPDVFENLWWERKTFEMRKNDRDFKVGDTLWLRETVYTGVDMYRGKPLEYTFRSIRATVTYMLDLNDWVDTGDSSYVVMAIKVQEKLQPLDKS